MADDVRNIVRAFVLERFVAAEERSLLSDDTDLQANGVLDSFSVLALATFLETRFAIELKSSDIATGALSSLERIDSLVRERSSVVP
jgi:acyl carrier protein